MPHRLVYRLRTYRKFHKYFGLILALFIFISSLTGILLSWKKNVKVLQPVTHEGHSAKLVAWKSFNELANLAIHALDSVTGNSDNFIDRIEGRPKNGIVKVLFKKGYWEVQLDASTGKVLSVARRHSDWIEHIHDGSIISEGFKLVSMNVLGWGLLFMVFSGFWLWYGPGVIRRMKH
jgi:uncharacterized iron-regulated membrane protein